MDYTEETLKILKLLHFFDRSGCENNSKTGRPRGHDARLEINVTFETAAA